MELYAEILARALSEQRIQVTISGVELQRLAEDTCCRALRDIKAILEDDTLSDETCFEKIEAIVRVYERLGSDGGNRHDFG